MCWVPYPYKKDNTLMLDECQFISITNSDLSFVYLLLTAVDAALDIEVGADVWSKTI